MLSFRPIATVTAGLTNACSGEFLLLVDWASKLCMGVIEITAMFLYTVHHFRPKSAEGLSRDSCQVALRSSLAELV